MMTQKEYHAAMGQLRKERIAAQKAAYAEWKAAKAKLKTIAEAYKQREAELWAKTQPVVEV